MKQKIQKECEITVSDGTIKLSAHLWMAAMELPGKTILASIPRLHFKELAEQYYDGQSSDWSPDSIGFILLHNGDRRKKEVIVRAWDLGYTELTRAKQ